MPPCAASTARSPCLTCFTWPYSIGRTASSSTTRPFSSARSTKNLPNPVRAYEVPSPETSIIKASVYVSDGTVMDMSYALARELGEDFVFAPSGRKWIDVMQRGVNKATGIRQVMQGARRFRRRGRGVRRLHERLRDPAHGRYAHRDGERALGHQADCAQGHRSQYRAQRAEGAAPHARGAFCSIARGARNFPLDTSGFPLGNS